ncbi:hypothetical protein EVB53_095 [Rhizobium phage RHph_Y60]|nr:hypothetical protein EVB53_095 [Rhizobium phage RHph_Y60]
MNKELAAARKHCNEMYRQFGFNSPEYNEAFEAVRAINLKIMNAAPAEEFCSIDSGVHRTRLSNGKVI